MCYDSFVKKLLKRSRVGMCALSAGWTGSCQPDEGLLEPAVHVPHPAATHKQIEIPAYA